MFTTPFTEDAISDSFTNEWFDQGYQLVLNRAAYIAWARIYGGTDESAPFMENALRMWAEEVNRLRAENARFTSGTEIRRRI